MGEAILIFVCGVLVLCTFFAIGIVVLSAIPIALENIAEIKEKWRELKDKGGVE